ncbi:MULTISPECIES: GerAB/ArcD/ProY family transporter [Paraliobacillus]|uniref:GerAB/ArcD/ProY family transporter n=1 Tax=Paraliobacillus TaxID=200903 RepID=UPI000DD4AE15|nr:MULTISPECIES: GerAB/ArcD/ProY family transporter [Paraliobacillus]
MQRISSIQLYTLIVAFEIGSTTLFALGIGAKQDAWLVVLLAFVISLILLWIYTQFPNYFPDKNFSEILDATLGTKMAKPLLLLYGLFFLNQAIHNFYAFSMLINLAALPQTPLLVILYLSIFITIYTLNLGFEVLARTSEILLPYLLVFLIVTFVVNFFSDTFELTNLLPVLGNGILPVIKELPILIGFPFGEMIVFLMFWHYVNKQGLIRKTTFLAVASAALLIIMNLIIMIAVLGPELTANTELPILETLLSINIANIITNLDSIAVFLLFIGGFFKATLHFMGFCLAITWFFNGSNPKWSITVFGLLLPLFATYRFTGLDVQRWKGDESIPILLLFAFLPVLLVFIIFLKKKTARKENNNAN